MVAAAVLRTKRVATKADPVAESEGKEDDIMKCCKGQKAYIPLVNDCFTDVKQCLGGAGLKNPNNVGRFGQNCDQCEKKK